MVYHHQSTIWDNMLVTFFMHLKQILDGGFNFWGSCSTPKLVLKDDDSHLDDTAHIFVHPGWVDDTNRRGHVQVILRHRSCCDSG